MPNASRKLFDRRRFIVAGPAACLAAAPRAQPATWFPPGSRLGCIRPPDMRPATSPRRQMSPDQTFVIEISERPRIDADFDAVFWTKDARWRAAPETIAITGFETRLVVDGRYGGDRDYGASMLLVRDANWMGSLEVSTSNLGAAVPSGPDLAARWGAIARATLASAAVRAPLSVDDMLRENGVSMDVSGLAARHFGNRLVLSLQPPRTPLEAWEGGRAHLDLQKLDIRPVYVDDEVRKAFDNVIPEMLKAGYERLDGQWTRGALSPENRSSSGSFVRSLTLVSGTRTQTISAAYDSASRAAVLAALRRVADSFRFVD